MDPRDRKKLRRELMLGPDITPVLLVYVAEITRCFLIPATKEDLDALRRAHRRTYYTDRLRMTDGQVYGHRYIRAHMGEWLDKYLVDDDEALNVPSGTLLIQTGKFP